MEFSILSNGAGTKSCGKNIQELGRGLLFTLGKVTSTLLLHYSVTNTGTHTHTQVQIYLEVYTLYIYLSYSIYAHAEACLTTHEISLNFCHRKPAATNHWQAQSTPVHTSTGARMDLIFFQHLFFILFVHL